MANIIINPTYFSISILSKTLMAFKLALHNKPDAINSEPINYWIIKLCRKVNVQVEEYVSRVDVPHIRRAIKAVRIGKLDSARAICL